MPADFNSIKNLLSWTFQKLKEEAEKKAKEEAEKAEAEAKVSQQCNYKFSY